MSDFRAFVEDYYQRFRETIEAFDRAPLEDVLGVFEQVRERGGTLWVAGNGGSAAIANHTICDATKLTHVDGGRAFRTHSLAANVPMLTALGNDLSYAEVFRQQLVYYLGPDDAVLLISSSGNSPNVVEACRYARERGVPTVAFVGFGGGELRRLADHVVWIPVENYGMSEDLHQSVMHCLTQYLGNRNQAP